jgi:hypothetical protein
MPKRLLDRCRPECILEFRASARHRYDEGVALAVSGQRTGAIYLWGYAAEMTLKAAYFALVGLADRDTITWAHAIQPAIARGKVSVSFGQTKAPATTCERGPNCSSEKGRPLQERRTCHRSTSKFRRGAAALGNYGGKRAVS